MSDDAMPSRSPIREPDAIRLSDTTPLIKTKTQVPRLRPDLLPRHRLVDFIHSHLDRRLILISAPAGYGKTSLLTDFAHDTDLKVCWYTLDPFDQDLHVFLEYLVETIAERFPDFGHRSRALLREVAEPSSNLYPIVATMVEEIYDTIPEYFVLVLDDHHAVENREQINAFLDLFVTYVDENCHVIVASRTLPALPNLSLHVARRQATGLSIDELRFTPAEVQALAERNYGLELKPGQAEALAQRTDGWITGLLLTPVSHWEQAESKVPIHRRLSVDLYDYLSTQVMDQQPAALRRFLMTSSVLDELSPELCATVLGINGSSDLINQVRTRNLFVIDFGEDVNRLRYHDLFREFLQSYLRRQDEARFRELTRRAASAYANLGEWERAVSRYVTLREFEPVAEIVERTVSGLFDSGRWDTLAGWIDALPAPILEGKPDFWVHRGKIHMERGEHASALELYDRAEHAFTAAGDTARAAHVLASKGFIFRFQGRYAEAIAHCEQALALAGGATTQEKFARALAYKNIGLCQLRLGQLPEGRSALLQALRLYEELAAANDMGTVHHDLGLSHELGGDLPGAVVHYQAALERWQQLGNQAPWANTLNGLGVVYYLQGKYKEARRTLKYTQALEVANRAHVGFIITYALAALGNAFRLQGNYVQATKQLMEAMDYAKAHESAYEIGLCHIGLGTLMREEGNLAVAREHLDETVELFEAAGFQQELSRAYLNRAQVAFLAKEPEAALVDLERALDLTAQLGFDQFLVIDGQHLQGLLGYAIERNVRRDVLHRLMERIEAHQAMVAARPEPVVQLKSQPVLEIYAFGPPKVKVDGQIVQWTVAQSRDLFFCLIPHRQGLRKEQVGALFWPDHTPQRLDAAFRSALYRLRRVLFRECIVFEDGVYRFNRASDHWFDVEVFNGALDAAEKSAASEEKIARLVDARKVYRGEYLEGIDADWATLERERLRRRYLASLEALAGLYAGRRNLQRAIEVYRHLLVEDSYQEVAHRELMRCLYRQGDRPAAIRQYQVCVEVLREELGLSPSDETEELYRKIIG
jgi:ATP/maltotriose-dependent transcriptional regulator MalT/DNA-binding SARP family transcriptional activator